jgi:uncharacterized protein YukE
MTNNIASQYNKLLENLSNELDISESNFKQAEERYKAIGKWLLRESSSILQYNPDIYPQGSFRLGTITKPITDELKYDIDLVCELDITKGQVSQKQLKEMVGEEIKSYVKANNMKSTPENKRRCWTLNYADGAQFHMDILPAIPDGDFFRISLEGKGISANWTELAIAITDKTHPNFERIAEEWPCSNPRGYAAWFKERMKTQFDIRLKYFAESIQASIEDVPEYKVKTPLQRAIQILKRHRDIRFLGTKFEEDKPISMIITTLSAKLYQNEEDVYTALKNIVEKINAHATLLEPAASLNESLKLQRLIEKKPNGKWYIPNPVNPEENFADKWHENDNRKARAFFQWVSWVRSDLIEVLQQANIKNISESLEKHFGENITKKASAGLYITSVPTIITSAKDNIKSVEIKNPSKPWGIDER